MIHPEVHAKRSLFRRAGSRLKRLVKQVLRPGQHQQASRLAPKVDEWSIGIYFGKSPYAFSPNEAISNPVLTRHSVSDVVASYVADPFMVPVGGEWYMFFEVLNRQTRKGQIGLATSRNGLTWTYRQIVLDEPFHLSYPYVFQWRSGWYMVPESCAKNAIRLYRAEPFPTRWVYVRDLIPNCDHADPSLIYHNERWWLFASSGNTKRKADNLHVFHANDLHGEWTEHAQSPVVRDNTEIARPGGRILFLGDRLVRYTQDCRTVYGHQVRAIRIDDLSLNRYVETPISDAPVVRAGMEHWNEIGMHHVDAHCIADNRWMACVDGWRLNSQT